ncbi:MAG: site-specific integrase [Endomicrobia bacterium]|nr:site-specific integrase [Endomicrobiia bacterium]
MASLKKRSKRYYIRDYEKKPKLDAKGFPVRDAAGNIIYKRVDLWIKSSKDFETANRHLRKYEDNKDRERIGLEKKHISWQDIKAKYLAYSDEYKADASLDLDTRVFKDIEEFCPSISQISDLDISFGERFFHWLRNNKKNADATIRRKGTTLKNLGKKFVDWGMMHSNPLKNLRIPKVTNEKEVKYWKTPEDIQKVIDNSIGTWKTINMVGFCIGARLSEILSLTWGSFDFNTDIYKIQSTGDFRTKSRKPRLGKIPAVLKEYLLALRKENAKNDKIKTDKIVVYQDGTVPTMDTCSSYLRKFYGKIGFKGYHAHCLRHTFAAHYLLKSKDIYGLSKLLGHYKVTVTQDYYAHLLDTYFDSSMTNFNPFE